MRTRRAGNYASQSRPGIEAIFPDLAKDVVPDRPNPVWVADLTYVAIPGGFVYLAAISMRGHERWLAMRLADRWTPGSLLLL